MRAHGGGLRACEADGRAVVEEVRGATEGESKLWFWMIFFNF